MSNVCASGECLNCAPNCEGKEQPVFVISSNGERPRAWIDHMFAKFAPQGRLGTLPKCAAKMPMSLILPGRMVAKHDGDSLVIMSDALRSMPHTVKEIFDDVEAQNASGMSLKLTITCVADNQDVATLSAELPGYNHN
jgi:hypothetical protein